jgi:hypothetical protein
VAWGSNDNEGGGGYGVYARQFATSTVTIAGLVAVNNVGVMFTDAKHYTVTVNGVATSYTTGNTPDLD